MASHLSDLRKLQARFGTLTAKTVLADNDTSSRPPKDSGGALARTRSRRAGAMTRSTAACKSPQPGNEKYMAQPIETAAVLKKRRHGGCSERGGSRCKHPICSLSGKR